VSDSWLIDSASVGDSRFFRDLVELRRRLDAQPPAPRDAGTVALIVRRGPGGVRESLARVHIGHVTGVPGDRWGEKPEPKPEAQISVMEIGIAGLIANGQPVALFGDNLFLDLDLSAANLPIASRVRIGGALLEVTPKAHNGCKKFRARFGDDALRFVSMPELRHRNLRGIYMRVIEDGEIAARDPVEVVARASR
jgi:hypothetical protein